MKKGWFVVLVLCVVGMALAACVDYAKAPAGILGSDVEIPVECYYNSDCLDGQKCEEGVCHEVPPIGKPDAVVNESDTEPNPDSSPLVGEDGGEGDTMPPKPDAMVGPDTIPPCPDTVVGPDTTPVGPETEQPDTEPSPDTEPDSSPQVGEDGGEGDVEPPVDTEEPQPVCEPSPEVCDGLDNDCDGHTDEGQPVFKTTCGTGACVSTGTLACNDGELVDSCVEGVPSADDATCDNKDNDCDGEIDEDFGELHSSCGIGACTDSGQVTCVDGKEIDSCVPKEPGVEDCTTEADDDCDGAVNEDCPCTKPGNETKPCGPAEEVGICKFGTQFCVDGGNWSDCFDEVMPSDEVCDGLDNDCDGVVDDGVLNACGGCGEVPLEVCDGVDNNCDGQTDEGLLNACGNCGDVPVEVCNEADDDCDGEVDEGLLNPCGVCGDVPAEVCGNGVDEDCDGSDAVCPPPPCEPAAEVCDGLDNDCDDLVDEGVKNACGGCGEVPLEVCDGVDNNCDGQTDEGLLNACGQCGEVPTEVCDETDNDCDGYTDEGVANQCGTCTVLEHVPGTPCDGPDTDLCQDDMWYCDWPTLDAVHCVTNWQSGMGGNNSEVCNGVDDDCDGETDEGVTNTYHEDFDLDGFGDVDSWWSTQACQLPDGPSPNGGVWVEDGTDCHDVNKNIYPGASEICNDVDDDCDGEVDEEFKTGACYVGDGACTVLGTMACQPDGTNTCSDELGNPLAAGQSSAEVCDGVDNDCDEETDEGVTNACGGCGEVPSEVCDGADNNCDGQTDEGLLNACGGCELLPYAPGDPCDNGDPDVCLDNVFVCDSNYPNTIFCVGGYDNTEVCDGVDNDCDGETDEQLGSTTCGVGACQKTVEDCLDGQPQVCVPSAPSVEVCGNGVDEDCDGSDLACPPPPPVCTPANLHGTYVTTAGVDGCLKAYTCGTYPPVTAGTASEQVSSIEFDFPLDTVCFNVSIDEDCDGDVEFDINTGEGWACNFWGVGYVKGLLIMEVVSPCDDGTTEKETMAVESQELAGGGNCVAM